MSGINMETIKTLEMINMLVQKAKNGVKPFSEATLDFMALNRVMDSREWFHEHHGEYERLVVEPLADLVSALTPALAEIDPNIVCVPKVGKSISRIWRDTRRGPGLPIYRDVMWITLLRAKYEGYPSFWFEFSPRCLRWGCGWYQTEPATMAAFRELILRGDPAWRAALRAYRKQERFVLEPERYKRSRFPDDLLVGCGTALTARISLPMQ